MALPVRKGYSGAGVSTTLTSNPTSSDTTFTVAATTNWPNTYPFFVVVDPGTIKEEKMLVTAVSTLTLTVTRGQDNTDAISHSSGAICYPVFTATEADEANHIASTLTTKGDLITTDGSDINRLSVGTNTYVLQADSSSTNGVKWGQVVAAGIAANAVIEEKINGGAVTLAKLAAAVANALVPVGTINAYAGATAPTGWLLCNGASTSGYTALAALVGATTPDLRGHTLVGKGSAPFDGALLTKFGSTTSTALHTHANTATFTGTAVNSEPMSQNAIHNHTQNPHAHDIAVANAGGFTGIIGSDGHGGTQRDTVATASNTATNNAVNTDHTHSVTAAGTVAMTNVESSVGVAHGNVQPSALVNFIIKHD
jgi:microcystin-dependent protein